MVVITTPGCHLTPFQMEEQPPPFNIRAEPSYKSTLYIRKQTFKYRGTSSFPPAEDPGKDKE